MKLKRVRIEGFRVFDDFTFEFPQEPGLYLLAGRNEDEPALGGNGVGKSTLFDAVSFVLFGKSALGLTGGDLLRDGAAAAGVRLDTDNSAFARIWSPTRKAVVELNGHVVSDKEVLEHIGLTHEMFTTATIIPQRVPKFAELKPLAQVSLLQDLLGLERWVTYATKANTTATAADRAVLVSEGVVKALEARIEAIDLSSLQRRSQAWADSQVIRIENAQRYEAQLRAHVGPAPECAAWEADRKAAESRRVRVEHNLSVLTRKGNEATQAADALQTTLATVGGELSAIKTAIRSLIEDNQLLQTDAAVCPSCHQPITDAHRKACLSAMATKIAVKNDVADARRLTHERLTRELTEARTKAQTFRNDWTAANLTVKQLMATISQVDRNLAIDAARQRIVDSQIQDAMAAVDDLKDEVNPHVEGLELAKKSLATAREQVAKAMATLEDERAVVARHSLWVKSFKSIRSQLVSDALHHFALEIAAVIEDLGLFGWEATPMIDASVFESARNASGFKFVVKNPKGVERALDAYSGGELVRVRLAIQSALGMVVADTHGTPLDFEFWDEPSEYLSGEGVEGLFIALRARAERLQRPIFVVDHHHFQSAQISRVYTLVKAGGTTTLEAT